ncbi:MAG: hypothetical protein AAF408_07960, partial [Pseudomonadota bacterium]
TIDGLHAMRRLLGHKKHKPMGVTICADEATLIATLANVLHGVSFADIFWLGTPAHYTTFLHRNGERFWCNGKPEFFDQSAWHAMCAAPDALGPQAAFARRLPFLDRIISPLGSVFFSTRECSIPEDHLETFLRESRAFFGCVLESVQNAVDAGLSFGPSKVARADLQALDNLETADQARTLITELAAAHPLSVFDQANYCARDIAVTYPGAYLAAALRGPKLRVAAARVDSMQSALDTVARIQSDAAVLADRTRIALPDEVLLFQTGDDVDKGFLLFCLLLTAAHASPQDKLQARLVISDRSTYCFWQEQIIDMRDLGVVNATAGTTLAEITLSSLTV